MIERQFFRFPYPRTINIKYLCFDVLGCWNDKIPAFSAPILIQISFQKEEFIFKSNFYKEVFKLFYNIELTL